MHWSAAQTQLMLQSWIQCLRQDGDDKAMTAFLKATKDVYTIQHLQPPELRKQDGYHKLAVHFGWALGKMFDDFGFSQVSTLHTRAEI